MSIPDEESKRKTFWIAGGLVGTLVVLSFILGYLTGSSGKTAPIIIQKYSDDSEILPPR